MLTPPPRLQKVIDRVLKDDVLGVEQVPTQALLRLWRDFVRSHRRLLFLGVGTTAVWCTIPYFMSLTWGYLADTVLWVGVQHRSDFRLDRQLWLALSFVLANSGLWLLSTALDWIRYKWLIQCGQDILFDLRRALHEKLQRLHVGFFDRMHTGQIFSRVIDDVGVIREFSTHRMAMLAYVFIKLVAGLALLFWLQWKMALGVLLTLPLYGAFFLMIRPPLRVLNIALRKLFSRMYSLTAERIGGIRVVKAFSREGPERTAFARQSHDAIRLNMRQTLLAQLLAFATGLLVAATTAWLFYYGALLFRRGEITPGGLIAFTSALVHLFESISGFTGLATQLPRFFVVLQRVLAVLDEPETVVPGTESLDGRDGALRLDRVTFRYPRQQRDALRELDFALDAGQTLAVMGPSGSGKSTLFALLLRFYDPTEGAVTVGGLDIRNALPDSLRRRVVMVQQEPTVFSGTLADNLSYGHPDATPAQIMLAAKRAEIHDFIMGLPLKYETEVGEGGVTLSGGQKQRLALATALLTDPDVLLLDDTTSALDAETEQRIRRTLQETLAGRTRLVITQRIATARACDHILVLEDGRKTQWGTHTELVDAPGFYQRIFIEQEGAGVPEKDAGEDAP